MNELIPLQCTYGCNAPLELIDYEKMIFRCEHCGTRYILSGFRESAEELKRKSAFLERARILMCDGEFSEADKVYDKLLLEAPHNAKAYLGKLKCKYQIVKDEELVKAEVPLYEDNLFIHALEYAEEKFREEIAGYNERIVERMLHERKDTYEEKKEMYQKANRKLKQEIREEASLKKEKEILNAVRIAIGVGAGIVDAGAILYYGDIFKIDCFLILLLSFGIGLAGLRWLDSYMRNNLQVQLAAVEVNKQKYEKQVKEFSRMMADIEAGTEEIKEKMKMLENVRKEKILYE